MHQEAAAAESIRAGVGSQAHREEAAGRVRERSPDGVDALWNWAYHLDLLVGGVIHSVSMTAIAGTDLDAVVEQSSGGLLVNEHSGIAFYRTRLVFATKALPMYT